MPYKTIWKNGSSAKLNRVGDIFPAALRRSSRACNPNLGFGSKSASIPRPLAAGFLIEILWRFIKYEWIEISAYRSWQTLVEYVEKVLKEFGENYVINFV